MLLLPPLLLSSSAFKYSVLPAAAAWRIKRFSLKHSSTTMNAEIAEATQQQLRDKGSKINLSVVHCDKSAMCTPSLHTSPPSPASTCSSENASSASLMNAHQHAV